MTVVDPNELSRDAWSKKEYRPVAVAIIADPKGRVFLVESAKKRHDWSFPQGGIDENEPVEDALFREIKEEVGIDRVNLVLRGYLGAEDLDALSKRIDKRGFTKGKRYFFFELSWNGKGEVKVDKKELRSYCLAQLKDVSDFLQSLRADKKVLLFPFLLKVAVRLTFGEPVATMSDKSSLDELRRGLKTVADDF